jgi:hypothetical protein
MPGIKKTMDEWKAGTLHSGSTKGPVVKSQKQAVAIGLSEERRRSGGKGARANATAGGRRRRKG